MERTLLLSIILCVWSFQARAQDSCPTVEEDVQTFCESEGTGNDFHLPMISDLRAADGGGGVAWYATADSDEALPADHLLMDGAEYFAGDASGTCAERVRVAVTISDSPNAGQTTFIRVNPSDGAFDLLDYFRPSILGPPDTWGTVEPELASGTTIFDPAVDAAGKYRYVVQSTTDCPDDFSYITVSIGTGPGDDPTGQDCPIVENEVQVFCESEGTGNYFYRPTVAHLEAYANGDEVVWFDTADAEEPLDPDELLVNGEDYYAGNASGSCTQRVKVTCTLNDSPNAGATTFITVKSTDAPFDLLDRYKPSVLGAPDAEGTFSPALASGTTIFDPAQDTAGRYKYTVKSSSDCPDDSSFCYVTIVPGGDDPGTNCPVVENEVQEFCESEGTGNDFYRPTVAHLQVIANGDEVVWFDTADSEEPLDLDELLVNGEDYYAGNASGSCTQRVKVTCALNDSPNAGATTFITVKSTDAPFDLLDRYKPSVLGAPDAKGTFSPALASGTTVFDPAQDTAGRYKYTVKSSSDCPDDSSFCYVTIVPGGDDPGTNCPVVESEVQEFCESQGSGNFFYRPTVGHLAVTANGDDVLWFDSATSDEPLDLDEVLVDGEDYYAGNASGSCTERVKVTCIVNDSPNAGKTTFHTVNSNDAPFDILEIMEHSILGAPDAGGTISPALAGGGTVFNPALDQGGRYTYSVPSSTDCPDDRSFITITVNQAEDAVAFGPSVENDVAVYPNPSNGVLNLATKGEAMSAVRIIDMKGQVVKDFVIESGSLLENLDISTLRPSVYFAEIHTEKGKVIKRIVKN